MTTALVVPFLGGARLDCRMGLSFHMSYKIYIGKRLSINKDGDPETIILCRVVSVPVLVSALASVES
jgi:hypothetical protein